MNDNIMQSVCHQRAYPIFIYSIYCQQLSFTYSPDGVDSINFTEGDGEVRDHLECKPVHQGEAECSSSLHIPLENSSIINVQQNELTSQCDIAVPKGFQLNYSLKHGRVQPSVAVTSYDGDRVCLRFKAENKSSLQQRLVCTHPELHLLPDPFSRLKNSMKEQVCRAYLKYRMQPVYVGESETLIGQD